MKEIYKQVRVEATVLFRKSVGVLIVLMVLFYALKNFVLFPLIGKIWELVLSTIPAKFITDASAIMFFKYPYLLLVGALVIVLYSIVVVWELSAIMMCYAYYDQNRPVSLLNLFPLSLRNIRHLTKKKNWLFFVYILFILPFTDLFSAAGMVSSSAVPEYIAEFIENSPILSFLVVAVYILLALLTIRWFYSMQGVLMNRKDFPKAREDSVRMIKGRMLRQCLEFALYTVIQILRAAIIPFVVCTAIFMLTVHFTYNFTGEFLAVKVAYYTVYPALFKLAEDVFLRMAVMSYLVVNYRIFATEEGIYEAPKLPESGDKKGKIHLFPYLRPACYTGITVASVACFGLILGLAHYAPETLTYFKSTTLIAAHKGLSSEAPENTMDSFAKAYDLDSVNLIELDVRESKDGIPIVIHNSNLKDACGVDAEVYDLNYEVIKSYMAVYSYDNEEYPYAYVPTLEEVIAAYGGSRVMLLIEIKADSRTPDLPQKIVDLLHQYNCADSCVIQSGNYEALEAVKAEDPSISCGFIIALGTGRYYDLPCADFFSVEHNFVNSDMIRKIHNLGKKVYAWTVDDESSIEDMLLLDVDVVITDYPDYVHDEFYTNNDLVDSVIKSRLQNLNKDARSEARENYEEGEY